MYLFTYVYVTKYMHMHVYLHLHLYLYVVYIDVDVYTRDPKTLNNTYLLLPKASTTSTRAGSVSPALRGRQHYHFRPARPLSNVRQID